MMKGLVVSDLHLFSGRSDCEFLLGRVGDLIEEADLLVLNGDTFDFRWSELNSEEETIAAAISWLSGLADRFGGERIHYIQGNHDCLAGFRRELEDLVEGHPVFRCHTDWLRLSRNLFLHGDCANRKMSREALKRSRENWSRDRQRGPVSRDLYNRADRLGLSRRFHDWYFPVASTVQRVAHHLDQVQPAWREEIDHCFFGHTHRPFSDHFFDGVRFHNTGSAIRGMGFQPLAFILGESRDGED